MKKSTSLLFIFIVFLMSCSTSTINENSKVVNLNVAEFKAKTEESNTVILDVRTALETAKGKIDGAIELDVKEDDFKEKVNKLDKDKIYLVYCRSGTRSTKACGIMEGQGFEKLYNLKGGFNAWKRQ